MAAPLVTPSRAETPAIAATWQVRLLGGFEIDDGRQRLTRLRSRAAVALLARVALAPARDHAREELAALLWPEADADSSRSRLRQTLSLLKAVLEPPGAPPVLLADRRVVRVAPGALWCDARAFEAAVRQGDATTAAALYRGELLPGFYDEWIHDERRRLATLHDGLAAAAAPAPPPAEAVPPAAASAATRLPAYLTRLIGADVAGARLLAWVQEHRLVTVIGPGGCGKTRLAVEVARHATTAEAGRAGPAPFDGAAFVSLVDVQDRTTFFDRLLLALRLGGGGDAAEQVLQALDGRRMLLVLDNAEQLGTDAAAAVARLAEGAPGTHWLVTSRRLLGLDGEHAFPLDTLPLPAENAPLAEVAMNPAVALFVDRARAHRADFHVSTPQRAAVVALVRWLGGLPLALELAASHVRTQSPADLLALLQAARREPGAAALAYLARRGVRSGSDPRHASMLAVVEGSWRLLAPAAQQMLVALSLLPAGARLPQAAALADCTPVQGQALLDDLADHCVLRVQPGQDGQPRHAPHEPVREYAQAQLDEAGAQALRRRLLDALLDWARTLPDTPPLPSVRDELPNIVLALQHAGADGRADDAALLVLLLQSSWGEIALPEGVLRALDALLAAPALDGGRAAGCHALAATRCYEAGRPDETRRHMTLAMQRLAATPGCEPAIEVMVLGRVARMHWRLDRDHARARELIAQALPLARAHQRPNSEASLLSLESHLTSVVDRNPARATELASQSLALWRQSGNRHLINAGRYNVAATRLKGGHFAEVLDEFTALAAEGAALQDWDMAAGAHEALGTALQGLRRWAESAAELRRCVQLAWDGLEIMALAYGLWNIPPALARLRQGTLAAETMGAAEALWHQHFGRMDASDRRDLKRIRRFCRVLLGADAAAAAWQRGAARPLADTVRAVLGR